jgi:hypothetical protein
VGQGQIGNPGRETTVVGRRTGEGTAGWGDSVLPIVNCIQTVLNSESTRLSIVIKNCVCPINPATNPNPKSHHH